MRNNILYLSLVQILRFVVPILTFPYLTRVLGVEGFGYLAFASAAISYSMIFCQYGFDLTATARIARIRAADKSFINKYTSAVLTAKAFLCFASLLLLFIFLMFYNDTKLSILILVMMPMLLGNLILPVWLFQGLGMMKVLTFIIFFGRLCSIPLVFTLVKSKSDLYLAGFLQAIPFFISGVISWFFLIKNKVVSLKFVRFRYVLNIIYSGWDVFLTSLASSVYLSLFPVLIGYIQGPISVGYFNVADTIRKICLSFFQPIYQTVFPKVNSLINCDKEKARDIIRVFLIISFLLAVTGSLFVYAFSDEIIGIVAGKEFLQSADIVEFMLIVIVLSVLNNFFGVQTLIPLKKEKELRKIVSYSAILCLFFSIPSVYFFDNLGAVSLIALSEFFIFIMLLHLHKKNDFKVIF
ncbi:MAG: oligosaccharide flippase family protein [Vibrio sp.]